MPKKNKSSRNKKSPKKERNAKLAPSSSALHHQLFSQEHTQTKEDCSIEQEEPQIEKDAIDVDAAFEALEAYRKEFMSMFESDEEDEGEDNSNQEENSIMKEKNSNESSLPNNETETGENESKENKSKGKVIEFKEDRLSREEQLDQMNASNGLQLDSKMNVTSAKARKERNKKKYLEKMVEQVRLKDEMKKLQKGDQFDLKKSSTTVQHKTENQLEMNKLMFEMQDYVYQKTLRKGQYKRFKNEELMKQGKAYEKVKNTYTNYKELMERNKRRKELSERQKDDELERDVFDRKDQRKERIRKADKERIQKLRLAERMGNPNEIGRADYKIRKRSYKRNVGTVGQWDAGGVLKLSKADVKNLERRRR